MELLNRVLGQVAATVAATWPFVVASVIAAAALQVYVGADRLGGWLRRRTSTAVAGAVGLAAATPFCSCGTTATALGLVAASAPWAPIVAFMVASPLTSPSELLLSAGLFGWPFALIFFTGTIVLGLGAGIAAAALDRAGLLRDQARLAPASSCAAPSPASTPQLSMGPGAAAITEIGPRYRRWRLDELGRELLTVGRRIAVLFAGFTFVSYLLVELVPTEWLQQWLGGDSLLSVVGAALLGVPMYVNTEGSLPMLAGLMDGGMGPGPAMAFLVTGAGTSIGAVTGMLVIARKRVVGLVLASLLVGAVALGVVTQLLLG